jgi:hypothetical protein
LGSDLIQGSKKMWNDFDKSLGSENGEWFDPRIQKICNENAKWLGEQNGEWFDLRVKKKIQWEMLSDLSLKMGSDLI